VLDTLRTHRESRPDCSMKRGRLERRSPCLQGEGSYEATVPTGLIEERKKDRLFLSTGKNVGKGAEKSPSKGVSPTTGQQTGWFKAEEKKIWNLHRGRRERKEQLSERTSRSRSKEDDLGDTIANG